MRSRRKRCLVLLVAGGSLVIGGCMLHLKKKLPRPRSDVPIITDIGRWNTRVIRIDAFEVEVVDADGPLHLSSSRALLRFRIRGELRDIQNQKPELVKVNNSERFGVDRDGSFGDISVTPIAELRDNARYIGESIPFDLKK